MRILIALAALLIVLATGAAWGQQQAPAQPGDQSASVSQPSSQHDPVDPVHFSKLVPLLGELPGWTARGDAEGVTMEMGQTKQSTANRDYRNEAGAKLEVAILDGGYSQIAYAEWTGLRRATQFQVESTTGYLKTEQVAGYPAIVQWEKKDREATVLLLVSQRFLVTLQADGVDSADPVKAAAGALPLDDIEALE